MSASEYHSKTDRETSHFQSETIHKYDSQFTLFKENSDNNN
jgi:hypothetical protein